MKRSLFVLLFLCAAFLSIGQSASDTIKYSGSTTCITGSLLLSANSGTTFQWFFNGTAIAGATSQTYSAAATGEYRVTVDATPYNKQLNLTFKALASFKSSAVSECIYGPVNFTNTTTPSSNSNGYEWNFDDPSSSSNTTTSTDASHTFVGTSSVLPQSFNVRLIATSQSCKDTAFKVVTVKQKPVATLTGPNATNYNGVTYFKNCLNSSSATLNFANTSSTTSTNVLYRIVWGDGSTDYTSAIFNTPVSHLYNAGNDTMLFIVTGTSGCIDTGRYYVFVGGNPAIGIGNPGNSTICTGDSLTFPITGTANNSLGTTYIVSFNDGSKADTFYHPNVPPTITHSFKINSCGTVSGNGSSLNSFQASIQASNACLSTYGSVVPIYVSGKPKAAFNSTKDTTCVNTGITVSNGSTSTTYVNNGVCTAGKFVWSITPSTGWTISSSSTLGKDYGISDPSVWDNGSDNLTINFSVAGTYVVKLKTGNPTCGLDSAIKTICVNPVPIAAFTVDKINDCLPLTVQTTNTSNTPNCGSNIYTWSVTYTSTGGCTPNTSSFVYTSGNANATNPQFRFDNPGTYTISLITKNSSGVCTSSAFTQQIVVKAKPNVTLTSASSICQNGAISPSVTVGNCNSSTTPTYLWTFTGGTPATSTSPNPGNIVYATAGTFSISVDVTNECGTTTKTQSITVNPIPTITAITNQLLCGSSATTGVNFASNPTGASFTWTNSNASIGLPSSGSGNSINSFTTVNSTTQQVATINVMPSLGGCAGSPTSFTITVNPTPTIPAATTAIPYCQGAIASALTATNTTGNTLNWYIVATGGTASTTAPTPLTNTAGTTNYYVSQINTTTNCESGRRQIVVTVNPTFTITGVGSNPTSCGSSTGFITLSGLASSTSYTVNYTFGGNSINKTISTNGSGNLIISGLVAGAYTNITAAASGCPSNAIQVSLSDPNPPATPTAIVGTTPICSGGTLSFTANSATSGVTYTWSGPASFTSTSATPTRTNATVAMGGTYSVTATLNGCTSSIGTVDVVVNQTPTNLVASNNNPCSNNDLNLNASSATFGVSYSWVGPNSFTNTSQNPIISNATIGLNGTYSVTATLGNCSASTSTSVIVKPTPAISSSSSINPTSCATATGSIILNGLVGNTTYTVNYNKNGSAVSTSIKSDATGILTIASLSAALYNNISVTLNGCSSNIVGPFTLTDPNPPITPTANSNSPICSGTTLTLSALSLTPGVTYNWVGPNTYTATGSTPTRSNATLTMSGNYSVTATLNSCVSSAANIMVVVNATPTMPTVTSNSPVCENGTILLTANTITSSSISYSWVGPNAFTSNNQNPTINNATTANNGNYNVSAINTNGNCSSSSASVNVVVNGALINTITGNTQTICAGQSVTITGQNPSGGNGLFSYQWQQSTDSINWANITGEITANITYNPTVTSFVRRFVTSSSCNLPSNAATIIVQPSVSNNSILKDTVICIGGSVNTLTGSAPNGGNGSYTYQWENSVDGGTTWIAIAGATNANYLPVAPTVTTKFRRRVSSNACTGLQANNSNVVTVTVNPDAKAQFVYTKDIDCAVFNLTTVIQNITSGGNGNYLWYANNNLIGSGTAMPNYAITNPFDSVIIKLKAISQYGCKNDSVAHKFYTVPKPSPAFTISDTIGCGPLSISVINKTPNANLFSFKWDFGNGVTSTVANPSTIVLQPNPTHLDTIYTITLSAITPCDTVKTIQKVRVKSKPQSLFTPDKSVGCSPFTTTFTNTSRGNNMTFVWDFGDGKTLATNNSTAVQHTFNTGKQDTFKVTLIATNECGNDTLIYKVVVSPNKIKLDFAVNGNEASSCLPSTVHFINNTSGATSFSWDFGDGNFLTTTKNIDTVAHTYTTPGSFVVKLSATNGCSDTTDYETVKVFASPIAKFTANPLTACLGDSIYFTNQTDTATGYTWRFGNGDGSSLTSPVYTYKTAGNYTVKLIAVRQYNSIVCVDSSAATISIVAKLTGAFKVSDSVSNCVPFNVVFTNLSLPSTLTTWDFNDGKKDTGNLVQHNFIATGTFNVKMNAINAGGCNYEAFKTIVVKGPSGTWVYDNGLICGNKQVRFQANVVNTDSLRFNFGDGTFLTTTNTIVYHTYAQSGNYLPSVDLLAGTACHITLQGLDTIKIDNIIAGFAINQQKACGTTTVAFNDTSRAFYGIQKWQWNFGDGSALSNIQSPQHSYTITNAWPVQLIVYGKSGCTDTVNQNVLINVNTKPKATIQANGFGCTNQGVSYTANITSVDSVILKLWKFYDGSNAVVTTVSKIYPSPSNYTTSFIVGTVNGCYDTSYNTLPIYQSPTVIATNDLSICKGQFTQLNATGSNNYSWSPANNISCTKCDNPIANPSFTTAYVVSTTSNLGCIATDTVVVTVAQPFKISVSANDSICIGQSTRLSASGAYKYSWSPAIGLSDATAQSPLANPIITTTYQVTVNDQYNCFTDVATVTVGVGDYPVLKLGQDQVLAAGTLFTFSPTFTNGPIKDWRWNPVIDLSCTNCPNPIATAKNDICYEAIATNFYGCAGKDTLCIKVFCQSTQVFIPNAFIPGTGSGVNDVLMVRGKGIKLVKSFRIFNRWGQVVFERANFPPNDRQYGWDGLVQGKTANSDVYVYTCEVVCENDVPFVYKGNVAILK